MIPAPLRSRTVGGLLLVAVLGVMPSALPAQETLEAVSESLAMHCSRGDLARVADLLSSGGVRVEVAGNRSGVVSARQAVAALADFHQDHQSVSTEVDRIGDAGGSPPRGFAQIGWTAIPEGTSEATNFVLFVSFVREDEAWMVSEIRILR